MTRKGIAIVAVALFMEQVDSTVIATALPAIAQDLGTSPVALKLAMTAYLVALAIFIPLSGWMADRLGARRVFMAAIGVFVLASVTCALADSLGFFVIARFVQGMGGAMMTPLARLILVRTTPRGELIGTMAWLTIPALVGPLIGPPLGGLITTLASWHWIFLINVPVGILGILAVWRYLPEPPAMPAAPMDWAGFALAGTAMAGIIFGLSVVSLPALPIWVGLATLAIGALSALAYVRHARRAPAPLLPLDLLDDAAFRVSVTGGSLFRIGIGAVPFLLPLMLQVGFHLSPLQSGLITFAGALGAMAMKFGAAWVYARFGFRSVLIATAIASALTVGLTGFASPLTSLALLYGVLLVGGFVRSLFFTGVNALAFAQIAPERAGGATAFSAVAQQASIAAGVAFGGMMLELTQIAGGHDGLVVADFRFAFVAVALVMLLGLIPFWRIAPGLGDEAAGRLKRTDTPGPHPQAAATPG